MNGGSPFEPPDRPESRHPVPPAVEASSVRDVDKGGAPGRWNTTERRARVLVRLYPPAWRARYGEEFRALLEDSGVDTRAVRDVLLAAASAWARPSRRLHDRDGRLRATVATTWYAWALMAAGAVLFAKLTTDGAWHASDGAARVHPVAGWCYDVFVLACCGSVLLLTVGAAPLAVGVLGAARGAGGLRAVVALLSLPATASLGFLGVAAVTTAVAARSGPGGEGVSATVFLALAVLGTGAAVAGAAGPAATLSRTSLRGPALTTAFVTGACATALLGVATVAGIAHELIGQPSPSRPSSALTAYGAVMTTVFCLVVTSTVRGVGAMRRGKPGP
ncbi:hypothetical protein [Streptomyces odontomachi]|uniref:hypothetical protein n=1 Tax=Streptomyces odontomachi TaxID=2944940 RepID=UPI00210BFE5B|nr:hypothetical protein [Streptomyces sp. ODS25]